MTKNEAAAPAAPVQDALTQDALRAALQLIAETFHGQTGTAATMQGIARSALLAAPTAPASEQDDWLSAVRAACSHLDYPIDAPQRVQDALRALKNSMVDATPATGESGAEPEAFYDGASKEPTLMWAYDGYKPGANDVVLVRATPPAAAPPNLIKFLDGAARDGLIINDVDAAELFLDLFPDYYKGE